MNSKKMSRLVTLLAVSMLGAGTILEAVTIEKVNAAETSTVVENKAEIVTFDLKNGESTALDFWEKDVNAKGLVRGQKYRLNAVGDGRVEIYHDHQVAETSDVVRFEDGKTMHITEQTFKDADSLIIRALNDKAFKITFTPIFDVEEESSESSSTESSSTESSSTESSSTESSSTNSSESGTTETSEEPSKYSFTFKAEKDGIYNIGLPTYNKLFNGDLELRVNGKAVKIKQITLKTGSDFWVFDDNELSGKLFELKKGDVVEATSKVSVTNFSEKHLIGSYSSLKNWSSTAQVYFNPETSTLEFEWNMAGKKEFENVKIEKEQKTVELNSEIYNLKWEKGVLVSIESTVNYLHFYNNNFTETLKDHAVFDRQTLGGEVEKMTEYKPLTLEEINAFKGNEKIQQGEDLDKTMQENLKIEYIDTTLKLNYTDYIASFHYDIESNKHNSERLYTVKLPEGFKDTEVFKQNVNKLQYTTVLQKYGGGGYTMLVVYAVINKDNTMTIVTDLYGHGGKGANFFDFDLEFTAIPEDEEIELPAIIPPKREEILEEPKPVIPQKEVKKETPRMGSNLANAKVFGTAGLALSLAALIRKKFPIK